MGKIPPHDSAEYEHHIAKREIARIECAGRMLDRAKALGGPYLVWNVVRTVHPDKLVYAVEGGVIGEISRKGQAVSGLDLFAQNFLSAIQKKEGDWESSSSLDYAREIIDALDDPTGKGNFGPKLRVVYRKSLIDDKNLERIVSNGFREKVIDRKWREVLGDIAAARSCLGVSQYLEVRGLKSLGELYVVREGEEVPITSAKEYFTDKGDDQLTDDLKLLVSSDGKGRWTQ